MPEVKTWFFVYLMLYVDIEGDKPYTNLNLGHLWSLGVFQFEVTYSALNKHFLFINNLHSINLFKQIIDLFGIQHFVQK